MKRALKVAALLVLGWAALWILFFSVDLFLGAVAIALLIRLAFVIEQRDEVHNDLVDAWFTIDDLEGRLRTRADVVDVPVRRFEHKRGTW